MAANTGDEKPHTRYDVTKRSRSRIPHPRRPPDDQPQKHCRPERAIADVDIGKVETVPMTADEFENAVEALAVLITQWWDKHPPGSCEDPPAVNKARQLEDS